MVCQSMPVPSPERLKSLGEYVDDVEDTEDIKHSP
jgi:hypothetical protein